MVYSKARGQLEQIIDKAGGSLPPVKNGSIGSGTTLISSSPANMMMGFVPNAMNGGKMITIEVQIPGTKCGLIIGKGGETIKMLQERAGVKMVMIQESNQVTSGYKPLRIIGEPDKIEVRTPKIFTMFRLEFLFLSVEEQRVCFSILRFVCVSRNCIKQ